MEYAANAKLYKRKCFKCNMLQTLDGMDVNAINESYNN